MYNYVHFLLVNSFFTNSYETEVKILTLKFRFNSHTALKRTIMNFIRQNITRGLEQKPFYYIPDLIL